MYANIIGRYFKGWLPPILLKISLNKVFCTVLVPKLCKIDFVQITAVVGPVEPRRDLSSNYCCSSWWEATKCSKHSKTCFSVKVILNPFEEQKIEMPPLFSLKHTFCDWCIRLHRQKILFIPSFCLISEPKSQIFQLCSKEHWASLKVLGGMLSEGGAIMQRGNWGYL